MNVQMRKVADLIPYERNAKEHDKKQISNVAKSIQKYGFVQPVVVDKDNVIVIGHCRVLGAKKLKLEEVPCVCVDELTPEQVNELRIVDNKTNESPWDTDILVEDLPFLPGLDEFEFDFNLPKQVLTGEDDDFDLSAALEKASFVVRGDVWTVGKHRLMCGDATIIDDVAKLMDGKKANCLLTDPPYGVSFKSSSGLTIQNDSMKEEEFYQFLYDAFTAAASFLVAGGGRICFPRRHRRAELQKGIHRRRISPRRVLHLGKGQPCPRTERLSVAA